MSDWKSDTNGLKKSLVEALGLSPGVVRQKIRTQVAPVLRKEWERIIDQKVDPHRKKRLTEGVRVNADSLALTLRGWEAVRTERGWVPLSGSNILEDGLGKYAPGTYDMRPIILGGRKSAVIKFESTKTVSETIEQYRAVLEENIRNNVFKNIDINSAVERFSRNLRNLRKSNPTGKVYNLDTSDLPLPKLLPTHKTSIFARIRKYAAKNRQGYTMVIYRTMTSEQRGKWITKGTPPANTIPELLDKLPEILFNVFSKT